MKNAANDNEKFFNSSYKLVRETINLVELIEQEKEYARQQYIQQQLIEIGRL